MALEIRKFDPEQDYADVVAWWTARKWPTIALDLLPKTGFIVEGYGVKICAGWLYKTDSKFALIEWIVSNPLPGHESRGEALDILMLRLVETAKRQDFKAIFSSIDNKRLIARYKKHGFTQTDGNMTSMIMRIN